MTIERVAVVDSHTGGEPTRIVLCGGPDLGSGSLAERCAIFRERHAAFRAAVVCEPRGSDVLVGALLTAPTDPTCAAGVIFFNNVGTLGMCGHGTIGVVKTLEYLGRIAMGEHRIETPVGVVTTRLHDDGKISVRNVASYRAAANIRVNVPDFGTVVGDVAYGGNWFFLTAAPPDLPLTLDQADQLTDFSQRVRQAVNAEFPEIDHIELVAPSPTPGCDARNFVLCPGGAYDRSPCGTGTSAKLACLIAEGKLAPGQTWRQESILGSVFEAVAEIGADRTVIPTITGSAFITGEATLLLDPRDPFCWGISSR